MPRGKYPRTKPTGFLRPIHNWTVEVARGIVFTSRVKRNAQRQFKLWSGLSKHGLGRAANQQVRLICDGELIDTYDTYEP